MSFVSMTGANGFLGWHTQIALHAADVNTKAFRVGEHFDLSSAAQAISGSLQAIHIAGVNRARTDLEVHDGNILFAKQFAEALLAADQPPTQVVFANSTQSKLDNLYGESKRRSSEIIATAAAQINASFNDILLPNLYGEHGVPFYNSVTSTFCHLLASGELPSVHQDKELTLLHAQNAADILIGNPTQKLLQSELEVHETVSGLLERLSSIAEIYESGEIPDVTSSFDRDLFNTYRSYTFERLTPFNHAKHADSRGSFFEIVRSHGGSGQTSFSTTSPGISRGDHYHRRKVERFTVLSGQATISLRKMLTDTVIDFKVSGETPVAIDMPTGWAHKIENTGTETLFTSFWSNEIFDPNNPDTVAEAV